MKVYTKTGDKGTTSLVGGKRVSKTHVRIEAYGTLDELNAQLGLLATHLSDSSDVQNVRWIQNCLFVVGTLLATDDDSPLYETLPKLTDTDIHRIEQMIDVIQENLPPLHSFVLPGGTIGNALSHICRTVCRRAERRVLTLVESNCQVDNTILIFLNRISDYLFVLSRKINQQANCDEFFYNNACD